MRRVTLGRTGIETSCLGFGCASLGSRVGAAEGLRALEAAFERGVTWLDLAPAYGRGAAEEIAAGFLKGRRDRVQIATKVGLAPPAAGRGIAGALMPIARRAIVAVPRLRGALRRSGVQANRKQPLTAALIRDSLDRSLRRLGTDHLDLYALHNAEPDEVEREEVRRALEDIVAAGKARAAAVAGEAAAARAAIGRGAPFGIVQIALPLPGEADMLAAARAAGLGAIAHSVFGVGGAFDRGLGQLGADAELRRAVLAATGLSDPAAALGRLLLARAFALNPDGMVLVSMFSARSLRENLATAAARPAAPAALADRLAAA